MLTLPSSVRIYVAAEPVDLRRGFDGLAATTRSLVGTDPMSGHVFVFLNRRRNRIKLLVWDRTGWLLLYKRLEQGTFQLAREPLPGQRHVHVDAGELALMLEGLDLRGAVRRKRWYRSPWGQQAVRSGRHEPLRSGERGRLSEASGVAPSPAPGS